SACSSVAKSGSSPGGSDWSGGAVQLVPGRWGRAAGSCEPAAADAPCAFWLWSIYKDEPYWLPVGKFFVAFAAHGATTRRSAGRYHYCVRCFAAAVSSRDLSGRDAPCA